MQDNHASLHVIFGTGPLGLSVMRALRRRGRRVRMINRHGRAAVPADVEVLGADASDPLAGTEAARGAAVVYQCAMPPYTRWLAEFPALQAGILEAAARNGARLVLADNLYAYGDVAGPLHEGLGYAARTRKGRLRAQMAETALAAHRAGKVQVVLGRGSDFFGPAVRQAAIGERALGPALGGRPAQLLGDPDQPHSFTYIDDFGEALAILGERDDALGQAWHVPNNPPLTQRELMAEFFRQIGSPPRIAALKRAGVTLLGLFIPALRETREMLYAFEKPYRVDSSRFERTFGLHPTPLPEAVARTLAWWREQAGAPADRAPRP